MTKHTERPGWNKMAWFPMEATPFSWKLPYRGVRVSGRVYDHYGCATIIASPSSSCLPSRPLPYRQTSWSGTLPPLLAHDRQFTSEEGGYDRLEEPLTLSGSICRADWVDGRTSRCRTLTEGGEKRTDGWRPQGCSICNILEASPCRDAYRRWVLNLIHPLLGYSYICLPYLKQRRLSSLSGRRTGGVEGIRAKAERV